LWLRRLHRFGLSIKEGDAGVAATGILGNVQFDFGVDISVSKRVASDAAK
jgi:hypothetical protein